MEYVLLSMTTTSCGCSLFSDSLKESGEAVAEGIEDRELQAGSVVLINSSNIENNRPPGRIKSIVRRMYVSVFPPLAKVLFYTLPNRKIGATLFLTYSVCPGPGPGDFWKEKKRG